MSIRIGNRLVGPGYPCFFIAEIGINHNGSIDIAKQLIDIAVEAGCDAVKFQKRTVPIVYDKEQLKQKRSFDRSIIENALQRTTIEGIDYEVFPAQSMRRITKTTDTTNGDLKYALEFNIKEYDIIDAHCRDRGIAWFASSWDGLSAHFINGYNVACHKIASACLPHIDLLKRVRSNGKPVILSTGGSILDQIKRAVEILGSDDLIILHCTAEYPATDASINLQVIETLKHVFPGVPIGYSGHEPDIFPSIYAHALGACVIERHITLSKSMPGSDQKASLEPHELRQLIAEIRRAEIYRGDGIKRLSTGEIETMKKLRRVTDF